MGKPAISFDFPPPVKLEEVRLVLPDDDEILEEVSAGANESSRVDESVSEHAFCGLGEGLDFVSGSSELNEMEVSLLEREEAVKQAEARLTERERSLWEFEALILAREKLLRAQQQQKQMWQKPSHNENGAELSALQQLRDEVARQQKSLQRTKEELRERQAFVEASEERLLEKTMQQQEEETRLEQLKEDLNARELRINQLEGKPPPPEEPKEVL